MTALAGLVAFTRQPDVPAQCQAMLEAQAMYAPAPPISWAEDGVALGRRLFETLPEDRYDRGPVHDSGGGRVLVADLRLDNRAELIRALGIPGACAETLSDADVLMGAIERWDEAAIERLVGEFALALWDRNRRRLLLARDFIGHRPLHYHRGAGYFAFASMAKGLHALPGVPKTPDRAAVARSLSLLPLAGNGSFFERIERVEPGHVVTVTAEGIASRRYWNPPRRTRAFASPAEAHEVFREQLDMVVAARLRGAERRVASHLSGGLDSSAVTTTAARLLAPSGEVCAFTSVPRGGHDPNASSRIADEWPLAAATAALYPNIRHTAIPASAVSPLDILDRSVLLYERPVPNINNEAWLGEINAAARDMGLGVLLNGVMGNLSFSYSGGNVLSDLFAGGHWRRLAQLLGELHGQGRGWPGLLRQTLGGRVPRRQPVAPGVMLAPSAAAAVAREAEPPARSAIAARVATLGRVDPGNFSKGALAGWGIDLRDPTADRRMIEFTLALPGELFLAGGVPRAFARAGLADRLPPVVLAERRGGYQAADWHVPLANQRSRLVDEVERIAECPEAAELLDVERMRAMVAQWPAEWSDPTLAWNYRIRLLPAICAGHFVCKAMERGS